MIPTWLTIWRFSSWLLQVFKMAARKKVVIQSARAWRDIKLVKIVRRDMIVSRNANDSLAIQNICLYMSWREPSSLSLLSCFQQTFRWSIFRRTYKVVSSIYIVRIKSCSELVSLAFSTSPLSWWDLAWFLPRFGLPIRT